MTESISRSAQFRGRSPPDRPEWEISTVARRTTNRDRTRECVVTGKSIPTNEPHYYVKLIRPTDSPVQPDEYDELVVSLVALADFEAWLENAEE